MIFRPSTDIYRYLWDGWLLVSGINPFAFVPNSPELFSFRSSWLYAHLEPMYNAFPTPYPPAAQLLFAIGYLFFSSGGLPLARLWFTLPWLVIAWLLWKKLPRQLWLILLIHPFVWLHLVRDAHVDGWATLLLCLSLVKFSSRKFGLGSFFLGLATMSKLYPAILWPALVIFAWRQGKWRSVLWAILPGVLVCLLLYLPFHYDLGRYLQLAQAVAGFTPAVYRGFGISQYLVSLVGLIGISILAVKKTSWTTLILTALIYMLSLPVIYPWYSLWLTPLSLLSRKWWLIILVLLIQLILSPIT